jgi:hypothetical protein
MKVRKSHVIVSGTGRAGTTFLVQLLTHLRLDTGFDSNTMEVLPKARAARIASMDLFSTARAGLEMDIRAANAPYIVKTPLLCDLAGEVLASSVRIEHAIIPVRQFNAAAASRAHVQMLTTGSADGAKKVPGGLWDTDEAHNQAAILRQKFTKLIEVLVRHDIPITFLSYPRLVRDPDYLYAKLDFLLGDIDLASFRTAFNRIVRPEWVHKFTEDDR